MKRRKTRKVRVGDIFIGGDAPVSVQSMTKTDTKNVAATVAQIKELQAAGCDIIRCAVPDMEAARKIGQIKRGISIPLVADIHFDWRLAVEAIRQGADKIRINPGNISSKENLEKIIAAARKKMIPVRIGVNSGSLDKLRGISHDPVRRARLMVSAAMEHLRFFERMRFRDIVISLKASDVRTSIEAYRLISKKTDYPLHLGITEAGTRDSGAVKSAVGLGALLAEGIGDTIRVSLTDRASEEVKVGCRILQSLGLRSYGHEVVSCPACGRSEIDIVKVTNKVESGLADIKRRSKKRGKSLTIAIMGCVVNGPGEAKDADIGIAGGRKAEILFKNGKMLSKVKEKDMVKVLLKHIKRMEK